MGLAEVWVAGNSKLTAMAANHVDRYTTNEISVPTVTAAAAQRPAVK